MGTLRGVWINIRYRGAIRLRIVVTTFHIWMQERLNRMAFACLDASKRWADRATVQTKRTQTAIDDYQRRLQQIGIPVGLDVDDQ